jgi:hypothetical protein
MTTIKLLTIIGKPHSATKVEYESEEWEYGYFNKPAHSMRVVSSFFHGHPQAFQCGKAPKILMDLYQKAELTLSFLAATLICLSGVLSILTLQFKTIHFGFFFIALAAMFVCSCFERFQLVVDYFKLLTLTIGKGIVTMWVAGLVFENNGFGLLLSILLYIFGCLFFVIYFLRKKAGP